MLAAVGCGQGGPDPTTASRPVASFDGSAMGTTYTVTLVDAPAAAATAAEVAVGEAIRSVDATMTTWAPSEVTRFNAAGSEPVEVSESTAAVVRLALDVSARTAGAFDITVAPLVDAWGFGARPEAANLAAPPTTDELEDLRGAVGWRHVTVLDAPPRLAKAEPPVRIDLSGVAKGYAVDRAAAAIEALEITDYLIELGGEIRVAGSNRDGGPWRVGIERPDARRRVVHQVIELRDRAMATSGDYRNYREVEGRRVTHIIDPRSGRPVEHRVASATVLHPSCAVADAVATAMLVLGEVEGVRVAEAEGWAVLLLVRSRDDGFMEQASTAFVELQESLVESDSANGA